MLGQFGIAVRTQRVYTAMIEHPHADLHSLAELLGIGMTDLQSELDTLGELMLVAPSKPRSTTPVTVPPHEALDRLIAREEARLDARRAELESTREDVASIVESFVTGHVTRDGLGLIERIAEGRIVRARLFQLVATARHSVASIEPDDAIPQHAIDAAARLDDQLLARKVVVRSIVSTGSVRQDYWLEHLRQQGTKGVQTRIHPSPPMRVVVFDDDVAVIPQGNANGALVLHSPDLVRPVLAMFDEVWSSASALAEVAPGDEAISEARMRQVATLMAAGLKDEAIARRLDVSVRTVRRLVAATITALQAESRFQAGVAAVRRGWVS